MNRILICIYFLWLVACKNVDRTQAQFETGEHLKAMAKSVQLYPDSTLLIEQYIQLLEQNSEGFPLLLQLKMEHHTCRIAQEFY